MKKALLITGLILTACIGSLVVCGAVGLVVVMNWPESKDMQQAGSFLTALKNDDYAAAWALCANELGQPISGAAELERAIKDNHLRPINWRLSYERGNPYTIIGQVTFEDGQSGYAALTVRGINYTMAGPTRYVVQRFELREGQRRIVFPKDGGDGRASPGD